MNDSASQYRAREDVVSTRLDDDESVLLSLETQRYYTLNETGSRVWELVNDGKTPDEIAQAISEEWNVGRDEALDYVRSFLDELHAEGLVEEVPSSQ